MDLVRGGLVAVCYALALPELMESLITKHTCRWAVAENSHASHFLDLSRSVVRDIEMNPREIEMDPFTSMQRDVLFFHVHSRCFPVEGDFQMCI